LHGSIDNIIIIIIIKSTLAFLVSWLLKREEREGGRKGRKRKRMGEGGEGLMMESSNEQSR
jgi:hypothetical protein